MAIQELFEGTLLMKQNHQHGIYGVSVRISGPTIPPSPSCTRVVEKRDLKITHSYKPKNYTYNDERKLPLRHTQLSRIESVCFLSMMRLLC